VTPQRIHQWHFGSKFHFLDQKLSAVTLSVVSRKRRPRGSRWLAVDRQYLNEPTHPVWRSSRIHHRNDIDHC